MDALKAWQPCSFCPNPAVVLLFLNLFFHCFVSDINHPASQSSLLGLSPKCMRYDSPSLVASIINSSASSSLIHRSLAGSRQALGQPPGSCQYDGLAGASVAPGQARIMSARPSGGAQRTSQNRILLCDHSPAADKSLNQWLRAAEQCRHFCLTFPRVRGCGCICVVLWGCQCFLQDLPLTD